MTGLWVLIAVIAAVSLVGVVRSRRDGRVRRASSSPADLATMRTALAGLGVTAGGSPVTLVQFSSAFCAPCRATRVVLADVAHSIDDVRHVEVDAETHLDAVRALGITRTPTTLVVDADGAVVHRAAGLPRREQVLAAVGDVLNRPDLG